MRLRVQIDNEGTVHYLVPQAGGYTRMENNHWCPSYAEVAAQLGLETIRGLRNVSELYAWDGDRPMVRHLVAMGYSNQDVCRAIARGVANRVRATAPAVTDLDTGQALEPPSLPEVQALSMSLLVGSRLYRLASSEDADANRQIQTAVESANMQLASAQASINSMVETQTQEVRRRVTELERELGRRHVMPNITLAHIGMGLRCWRDGDYLRMSLPFRYAPKYLIDAGTQYRIKPETAAGMAHDVYIWAGFRGGVYQGSNLLLDAENTFSHYHHGCWGSLTWPGGDIVQAFIRFRDEGQRLLEVINGDNLAHNAPRGLPVFRDLLMGAEDMGTWEQGVPVTTPAERRRGWRT